MNTSLAGPLLCRQALMAEPFERRRASACSVGQYVTSPTASNSISALAAWRALRPHRTAHRPKARASRTQAGGGSSMWGNPLSLA